MAISPTRAEEIPVTSAAVRSIETVPSNGSFPSYCATDPNMSDHAPNELALEFLFFDLSSCVQDDKTTPVQPPPK